MIPIYRAKKIDSDVWVEGYLIGDVCHQADNGEATYAQQIIEVGCAEVSEINWSGEIWVSGDAIDPNTLAIHFPNMIDKNGKKIFASLSKDGVGGDLMMYGHALETDVKNIAMYDLKDSMFGLARTDAKYVYVKGRAFNEYIVIGIHKGEES